MLNSQESALSRRRSNMLAPDASKASLQKPSSSGNRSGLDLFSRRIRLGARMKARRLEKELTHQRLAAQITYSESMVGAHIERGDHTRHQHFTEEVERVLGFNGELLELLPEIHADPGPEWFRDWPGIESAAHTIRAYQLALIPGLLRYAATLFKGEPAVVPSRWTWLCGRGSSGRRSSPGRLRRCIPCCWTRPSCSVR
ncbi:hypothetical protein AB0J35_15650 [Nonomuraea angiospora]